MTRIDLISTALAALALVSGSALPRNNGGGQSSTLQSEYLFTINYKFGGASPIIFSQGVTENANSFVGAAITGPALNGQIDFGVITNRFVAYGTDTIVFEEATWYGTFDNGDKGNGTLIARTQGLVDYKLFEQQRVTLTLTDGDYAYLQYIAIDCLSTTFDLRSASASQDCYRVYGGNPVVLPPIFGGASPAA